MPVVVIAVSMLVMLVVTTPSACRHHQIDKVQRKIQIHEVQEQIGQPNWHKSMSEMLPDDEPEQMPWVERWANVEPSQLPIVVRWDIVQVAQPPIIESKQAPMVKPLGVLAFFAIVLTLGTIEVLHCSIKGES